MHARYTIQFRESLQRSADEAALSGVQQEEHQKLKYFPEEQSLVPSCTGHKSLLVTGNRMLVLGGGNRYSYMSLKHITTYHTTTGVWSKVATLGSSPPSSMLHHAAAVIDESNPRHVLLLGGTRGRKPNSVLYLLDSVSMQWNKLKPNNTRENTTNNTCSDTIPILGRPMSPRTGHSMTSLSENISFLSQKQKQTSKQQSNTTTDTFTNEKLMIVFGGYSNEAKECYNDIHIISAQPCLSTQNQRQREFNSALNTSTKPNLQGMPSVHPTSDVASDPCYEYSWRDNLLITGSPPEPRLAHTATVMRPTLYTNTEDCLLIFFGGVGTSNIYSDVHVLNTNKLNRSSHSLHWMKTNVQGTQPSPRYGHTAVALDRETIVYFGGVAHEPLPLNDIYILNLENINGLGDNSVCNFLWSKIDFDISGPCPCPRSRHTAIASKNQLYSNGQQNVVTILVLGGTTRIKNRPLKPNDSQSVDCNLHQLTLHRRNQIDNEAYQPEEHSKHVWEIDRAEWQEVHTHYLHLPTRLFNTTPIVSLSSFAADIAALLDVKKDWLVGLSDLSLIPTQSDQMYAEIENENENEVEDEDGNANKSIPTEKKQLAQLVRAHRVILTVRSRRLRAMLTSGMRESRSGRVICETMPYNILFELVHYLYSDNVTSNALNDPNMLMRLLVVAGEYTLERLSKICEGVLLRLLHPENAAEFLEFADTYSIAGTAILLSGTYSFLLRNFEEVKETTGFKELPESLKHEVETRRLGVNIYKKSTKK
tara:strand:- start:22 stop:2307 length:2286 start_codon:yes stop_codon:yes gene_type:complete